MGGGRSSRRSSAILWSFDAVYLPASHHLKTDDRVERFEHIVGEFGMVGPGVSLEMEIGRQDATISFPREFGHQITPQKGLVEDRFTDPA